MGFNMRNRISYFVSKWPVGVALIFLCCLFSCMNNQLLDIEKSAEYKIGDAYLSVKAPKGYCINQSTRISSKRKLQFILTDCIGTASASNLKRRPVSSIISVNVLYEPGLKSFSSISGLVKNAGGIEDLELIFGDKSTKIRNSSFEDNILFLSLENPYHDVALNTGKFFFKALTLRDNVLITVTSYGFSQKANNRIAHSKLNNKLKSVINSLRISYSNSS